MSIVPPLAPSDCQRIYYVYMDDIVGGVMVGKPLDAARWDALCKKARTLGFDSILTPPLWSSANRRQAAPDDPDEAAVRWGESSSMGGLLSGLTSICTQHGLGLMIDLVLDKVVSADVARLRRDDGHAPVQFIEAWSQRLCDWVRAGVAGFRCRAPSALAKDDWRRLIDNVRSLRPRCHFMAWTPGLDAEQLSRLEDAGFDATFSSLPWWDYRATWFIDEQVRLGAIAPVFSPVADPDIVVDATDLDATQAGDDARRKIWTAAIAGSGILVTSKLEKIAGPQALVRMNKWLETRSGTTGRLRILSGAMSPATVLFRSGAGLLINPDAQARATKKWADVRARLPHDNGVIRIVADLDEAAVEPCSDAADLKPAGYLLFLTSSDQAVTTTATTAEDKRKAVVVALRAPRITIGNVSPEVDDGRFPVKTQIGEVVLVQADIFMDGHDRILASVLWRAADETSWRETPMTVLENDRWEAQFSPTRIGKHCFTIRAWHDRWGSYREQLARKLAAGQDVSLNVEEGRALLLNAVQPHKTLGYPAEGAAQCAQSLTRILDDVGMPQQAPHLKPRRAAAARRASELAAALPVPSAQPEQIQLLLSEAVAIAMRKTDVHQFEAACERPYELSVERREASFASWYELFPRSCGPKPGVHGTFKDVMKRLPAIRDMGFDVLYFPPIHPIGLSNRKGKNNSLDSGPDDPGSPYAIGSALGGHTSVHPQLGTLQDFQTLVECARRCNLEIALDFAIQCSPDHPWLTQHPEWFSWRADGSLRYAENPPKRYEDIVTPDFYSACASASKRMALWRELRDVVLLWI
ncbi:MAG: maltotransferase domain-containing protein, partial [Burkholderiaceae bacterium]